MDDLDDIPAVPLSLQEWREFDILHISPRGPWDRLAPWFKQQGLELFDGSYLMAASPGRTPRAPDGIAYTNKTVEPSHFYQPYKPIHYYARNDSGHDVLIRLICKGKEGKEELDILKYVCTGHLAFLGENHCLPLLRLLSAGDMTFGVFPVMAEGFSRPWYYSIAEIFDAVMQLLEGLEFLHEHLIAHRDIGQENILINYIGGARQQKRGQPFRSTIPVRYYYIDFELSIRFSPDSKPEDRLVRGIPIARRGYEHPDDYGRDLAPEINGNEPYDPFKADIYQLGKMFHDYFKHLRDDLPGLVKVFEEMTTDNPSSRPTASQSLESIRAYERTLSREQLRRSAGEEPEIPQSSSSEMNRKYDATEQRKLARTDAARQAEIIAEFRIKKTERIEGRISIEPASPPASKEPNPAVPNPPSLDQTGDKNMAHSSIGPHPDSPSELTISKHYPESLDERTPPRTPWREVGKRHAGGLLRHISPLFVSFIIWYFIFGPPW